MTRYTSRSRRRSYRNRGFVVRASGSSELQLRSVNIRCVESPSAKWTVTSYDGEARRVHGALLLHADDLDAPA
jgi:hypothetical protein